MKALYRLTALLVFLTCSTVAVADTSLNTFDSFTQDDGVAALEAGDALGFEVIPRAELEEVRGENWQAHVVRLVYYYGGFSLIREAAGDFKWVSSKLLVNPNGTPVTSSTAHSTPLYYK